MIVSLFRRPRQAWLHPEDGAQPDPWGRKILVAQPECHTTVTLKHCACHVHGLCFIVLTHHDDDKPRSGDVEGSRVPIKDPIYLLASKGLLLLTVSKNT